MRTTVNILLSLLCKNKRRLPSIYHSTSIHFHLPQSTADHGVPVVAAAFGGCFSPSSTPSLTPLSPPIAELLLNFIHPLNQPPYANHQVNCCNAKTSTTSFCFSSSTSTVLSIGREDVSLTSQICSKSPGADAAFVKAAE